jgi:hypothetical protein
MKNNRSLSILGMFALMAGHHDQSAHARLLTRLDRSVSEAGELCSRAQELYPDDPDGAIADAFQTVLARPARDWLHRAEALVGTVSSGRDTVCGARAAELRTLIDHANVAMMRQPTGREAWRDFYRSVMDIAAGVAIVSEQQ